MRTLLHDLRYGLRMLRQNPGFAAVAILTLAVGIGVNSAVFCTVDALLLRPLPVEQPNQLVRIYAGDKKESPQSSSDPDCLDIRSQTKTMTGIIANGVRNITLEVEGRKRRLGGTFVSANYFQVLGVKALLGQTFNDSAVSPDSPPVAVISYRLWQNLFGGDPGVVGRHISAYNKDCLVPGVVSREFQGTRLGVPDLIWIPIRNWILFTGEPPNRGIRWLEVMGRLRPRIRVEQAQVEIETVTRRLALEYPATNSKTMAAVLPESKSRDGNTAAMSGIVMGIALLVLLIACANVSNLLLARSEARRQEMAMRLAVGAAPDRLVRQLLTEGLLLTFLGAAGALLLASWTTQVVPPFFNTPTLGMPVEYDFRVDARVIVFTLLISSLSHICPK